MNDNPMKALLKQTTIMTSYKAQFKALFNRLCGHLEQHKLNCFLSSLRDDVWLPIRMLNPINLNVAFGLAKIQEEYLNSTKRVTELSVEK